jgi:hypothetical protein
LRRGARAGAGRHTRATAINVHERECFINPSPCAVRGAGRHGRSFTRCCSLESGPRARPVAELRTSYVASAV